MELAQGLRLNARRIREEIRAQNVLLHTVEQAEQNRQITNVYSPARRQEIFGIHVIQNCTEFLHSIIDEFRLCYESENYAAQPPLQAFPSRAQIDAAVASTMPIPPPITAWQDVTPMSNGIRVFFNEIISALGILKSIRGLLTWMSEASNIKSAIWSVENLFDTCQRHMGACLTNDNFIALAEHLEHVIALEAERTKERQLAFSMVDHGRLGADAGWPHEMPLNVMHNISELIKYDPGSSSTMTSRAVQDGGLPHPQPPRLL